MAEDLKSLRVMIADDEPVLVQAVGMVLKQVSGIEVVGTASNADDAVQGVKALQPDILIHELSFNRGSGIDLVRDVVASGVPTRCMAFTRLPPAGAVEHYFRAGGFGFMTKSEDINDLVRAIRAVAAGERFVTETQTGELLARLSAGKTDSPVQRLSTSEYQVLQLISQGLANRDIAQTLHRSVKTVETYRARIKKKLGLTNAVELAQYAARAFEHGRSPDRLHSRAV